MALQYRLYLPESIQKHVGDKENEEIGQNLASDIERVQRVAVNIILDNDMIPYDQACVGLGLKPLAIRRQEQTF